MKNLKIILFLELALLMLLPKYPIEEKAYTQCYEESTEILQKKNFKPAYHWKEIRVEATAYCSCKHCTGWGKGITASGKVPSRGTIAAPKHLPFGTVIKLDGLGEFTVEDRGGGIKIKNGVVYIDVWMESHQEAIKFGRKKNLKGWIKIERIKSS